MVRRGKETSTAPGGGISVETKLHRIAIKARNEPKTRFTRVYHLMNRELLRGCFERLRGDAAAGIDRVTKEQYGQPVLMDGERLCEEPCA